MPSCSSETRLPKAMVVFRDVNCAHLDHIQADGKLEGLRRNSYVTGFSYPVIHFEGVHARKMYMINHGSYYATYTQRCRPNALQFSESITNK